MRWSRRSAPRVAAVLFISHRLADVFTTCQRVTVMRDGRTVMSDMVANVTVESIIRAMVGRDVSTFTPRRKGNPEPRSCGSSD